MSLDRRGHYDDPRYYTKAYRSRRDDVVFYRDLALANGGPVLEYGVGNGRVALAIAREGVPVVGVDCSRPMLDDLRGRLLRAASSLRGRVALVHGDMRTKRLRRRFPLVIAPFNVVLHLYTRKDVELFCARVREHLTPRGRLVFDFSAPHPADLCLPNERWFGASRLRDPSSDQLVRYAERFEYDAFRQLLTMFFRFSPVDGSPPWQTELVHRQWFPQEMAALLHYCGFSSQRWTADFGDDAPDGDADTLVVECSPRTVKTRLL